MRVQGITVFAAPERSSVREGGSEGVELQVTGWEIKGVDQAEENDYSDERMAEFLTKVFNYLRRSQARPGQWKLYFHLDNFLDFHVSDEATFTEVTNDTN